MYGDGLFANQYLESGWGSWYQHYSPQLAASYWGQTEYTENENVVFEEWLSELTESGRLVAFVLSKRHITSVATGTSQNHQLEDYT